MTDVLDILADEGADLAVEEGFPAWLDPMLATLVDEPFSDENWIYERKLLDLLGSELRDLEMSDSPFDRGDPPSTAHWVQPSMVVEIGFAEWTDRGRLRHPRYLGPRRDKPAEDVVREMLS
jgi:ATP-dependent DNA ligase